jgi:putative spermidine/putrescine transport system substrate-binding protein
MRITSRPAVRRLGRVAAAGAAVATLGVLAACAPAAEGSSDAALTGEVVFADYGGPTNESRQISFFDSFDEESGATVTSAVLEDSILYDMLGGEDGPYDLVQVAPDIILNYADGLATRPDSVPVNDTMPELAQDYAVGGFVYGIAQGWLTETFADGGPQDWADFFDTETYPGKRAWPGSAWNVDASYEIALLADGVAPEDLYPLDIERAQAKLDTIRDDLVFYESYAETQTLLTSGTASIAVTVTGQFVSLINQGVDVTIQWNEAFPSASMFVVPATAPNQDNAWALGAWMADPERQKVFVERTGYGPATSDVFDLLDSDTIALLPNSDEHLAISVSRSDEYLAEHLEEMVTSYGEWLTS